MFRLWVSAETLIDLLKERTMKTYTVSVKEEVTGWRVALRGYRKSKDEVMKIAWEFSQRATLCDVVVDCGGKHVVTYRDGRMKELNGKGVKL